MSLHPSGLSKFLNERISETGSGQETHQLGGVRTNYRILPEEMDTFRKHFCDYIESGGRPPSLFEKITLGEAPLRVDLDFNCIGEHSTPFHTRDQMKSFMCAYMAEVSKYLEIKESTDIYVMEKAFPTWYPGKNLTKSGIHIVIPSIISDTRTEQAVRVALLNRMSSFFPDVPLEKGWRDAYDESPLTRKCTWWPMLGSKKWDEHGGEPAPYRVKYILEWDPEDGKVAVDDARDKSVTPELVKKLSLQTPGAVGSPTTSLGAQFREASKKDLENRVPISGGRAVTPARGRPAQRGDVNSRESSPNRVIYQQPLTETLRKYYADHVDNLSDQRFTEYNLWVDVCICLKNIHPDLNQEWHNFSMKAQDKYDFRETEAKWMSVGFRNDGNKLGIGSLRFWSRTDNTDRYLEIEKTNIESLVKESAITQAEHDVAQVVYAMYRDEFKCAKFSANVWYRFIGHVWRETDKGVQLQLRLSSDVVKEYRRFVSGMDRELAAVPECDPKAQGHVASECQCCQAEKKKKSFMDVIMKLKRTGFKKSVMDECRELFLDEEFANKVDENKRLIAFRNGILDMSTTPPVFRDGKPEDYVSFCTNLDYNPNKPYYTFDCWPALKKCLDDILPDPEVRTYFLSYLANSLSGENDAQKFHILTGEGSNGKSMLMILMSTTMGDYACTAPISLLTQGRNKSAAAAPELVRMKGRRFVTMQEPDEQVPLNTGLMKELASSEKITARDLYAGSKQMIDFELQARFNLACNEKPKINTQDGGTWRRLVVVNFPTKFVPVPRLPHEKPMDENMKQNCMSEEWTTAFLSYLVHLFTEGKGLRKLIAPEKVMEYIAEYREDSDVIAKFLREKIHAHPPLAVDEQVHDPTSWTSITCSFSEWKRTNELMNKGTPADLKKRLESTYGKMPKGGWTSFRCGDA
jgi:P4 family phage/plasmid primase-like protien